MIVMTERLQSAMDELKLTNAETYYHSLHVKKLVYKMLKFMNREKITDYTPEEIDCICKGAILHDIGKLGVKNLVLTKNSSLTEEEMNNMKNHTECGFELVKDELAENEYEIIKDICLYHHERTNGEGYKGRRDLPVYLQIVSICDVYDALTSDRVYRKGFSHEAAIHIIKDGGSGHFEQGIIECLEQVTCSSAE